MSDKPTWDLDADLDQADWTKTAWDLPPYRSKEFYEQVGSSEEALAAFRKLPTYAAAVASGLIIDDEWAADWIDVEEGPDDFADTEFSDTEQPEEDTDG